MPTNPESEFQRWTDERVVSAVNNGAANFASLIVHLKSIYPSVVLESLQRLSNSSRLSSETVTRFQDQATRRMDSPRCTESFRVLPVPHPLDYDWRFSPDGVEYLLEKHPNRSELLVCLGAPSIFSAAIHRTPDVRCVLLDGNAQLISTLKPISPLGSTIHCDLLQDPIPPLQARTVIADPPWYPEYVRAFLWCGRSLLMAGGHLLLSLPPEGTRPGVDQELAEAIAWASLLGLRLLKNHQASVRYVTPPFERNALHAQGIYCVPDTWRAGDILEFECAGPLGASRPVTALYESTWSEVSRDGVRIRVAAGDQESLIAPQLLPLVPGDILASVSRRDPRRSQARVWTSGNRVFGCSDPRTLAIAASAYVGGNQPQARISRILRRRLSAQEQGNIEVALHQLESIIRLEREEYGLEWLGNHRDRESRADRSG